ncbi:hypothetical protein BKA70DRAFT_1233277 [Coprinopsis sp. MPI-PUGE-AT-0042]|nr:hypothetical protein BKA70DRAFT_1233277 [Coprinopsis sp. MPI-PUGE-AT-0042]
MCDKVNCGLVLEPGTPGRGKAERSGVPGMYQDLKWKKERTGPWPQQCFPTCCALPSPRGSYLCRGATRDEHSSEPERATPRETGDRRSGQTGKRRRQARGLRVSESGAIDRNGSGTEGTRGSLRIRKRNGRMSGPKSIPKVSWMAEGFGSGPEARECSGTRDMGWKRAEASRSSVARRRRQGDGIEQWWDGWGSDDVQPASVGPEMVRSSAVRGQGVLWHMTPGHNCTMDCHVGQRYPTSMKLLSASLALPPPMLRVHKYPRRLPVTI